MFSNKRTYFPEELSLNGHTLVVTDDFWINDSISVCSETSKKCLHIYEEFHNEKMCK